MAASFQVSELLSFAQIFLDDFSSNGPPFSSGISQLRLRTRLRVFLIVGYPNTSQKISASVFFH